MFTDNQVGGGRMWFPCIDDIGKKCLYSFEITVDEGLIAICNGTLIDQVFIYFMNFYLTKYILLRYIMKIKLKGHFIIN